MMASGVSVPAHGEIANQRSMIRELQFRYAEVVHLYLLADQHEIQLDARRLRGIGK
jgi:hypothetical protein